MAVYTTYEQIGQAEDISDLISNLSPTEVPFSTAIGSDKASARVFEWQEDTLRTPAANSASEGAPAVPGSIVPTSMRTNYQQILEETYEVSGTARAVKTYGRRDELSYQASKSAKQLRRDLEFVFLNAQTKVIGDNTTPGAGTERKMDSYQAMIASGNRTTADAGGGSADALDEAYMLDNMQKVWTAGGEFTTMQVKPTDALIIAGFSGSSGRTRDFGNSRKIVNVVDIYVSPYGQLTIQLNRWLKATDAILFDPANWEEVTLRGWQTQRLAKDGDRDREQMLCEKSLKHLNFAASGLITNLS